MPGEISTGNYKPYLRVIKGKIVQPSQEGAENAVCREYERRDGTKGVKWEIPYNAWEGKILRFKFKDTDFGEDCYIEMEDAILVLSTSQNHFSDFAKKLNNIDLSKPAIFRPYYFEVDGKTNKGLTILQDNVKVASYYFDPETRSSLNGFPQPDFTQTQKKTYWQMYFLQARAFLGEEMRKHKLHEAVVEKTEGVSTEEAKEILKGTEVEQAPTGSDLPF